MPQKEKVAERFTALTDCQTAVGASLMVEHHQGNEQAFLGARPASSIRDSALRGFQADCAVGSPGCQLISLHGLGAASSLLVLCPVSRMWGAAGCPLQSLFLLLTSVVHPEPSVEPPHWEGRARLHRKLRELIYLPCKTWS